MAVVWWAAEENNERNRVIFEPLSLRALTIGERYAEEGVLDRFRCAGHQPRHVLFEPFAGHVVDVPGDADRTDGVAVAGDDG